MIKLCATVRKLQDSSYMVSYWWTHCSRPRIHRRYFFKEAEAAAFVSDLVTRTRWED